VTLRSVRRSRRGYGKDDVNVVMSDATRNEHFAKVGGADIELGTNAAEGAGVGGAIGGTPGAIAAPVAAVGTALAIRGLGIVRHSAMASWPSSSRLCAGALDLLVAMCSLMC
jgi:hypothetical protein